MEHRNASRLRLLSAEMRGELQRIEKTVAEIDAARVVITRTDPSRLSLYGAAALLETFYTGVEKTLARIASSMGGLPEGPGWHRRLLDDSTLDLPKLRPPVLNSLTAQVLEPYLAFRHRLRNLYLFDLDQRLVTPLIVAVPEAWKAVALDFDVFANRLEEMADGLEG